MAEIERTTSNSISIGTGLALETIFDVPKVFDEDREVVKEDIERHDIHYWSLHTIVRNLLNSFKGKHKGLEEPDFENMLIDEINLISNYYSDTSCRMLVHYLDYVKLALPLNKGKDEKVSKKQIAMEELNNFVMRFVKKNTKLIEVPIVKLTKTPKRSLITTSFLLDLSVLERCTLLESHTGVIKRTSSFYTKYHKVGKKDLSHLPYSKTLHKVLGDTTYVKPMKLSDRLEALKALEKVNVLASESRVRELLRKTELKERL